jgi:ABC-type Fe3+-hydroxamate transport system substrate-binding protein
MGELSTRRLVAVPKLLLADVEITYASADGLKVTVPGPPVMAVAVGVLVAVLVETGVGVDVDPANVTTSWGAFAPASREARLVLMVFVLSISRL